MFGGRPSQREMKRTVAWFVPKPLINLILLCVAHSQKHP